MLYRTTIPSRIGVMATKLEVPVTVIDAERKRFLALMGGTQKIQDAVVSARTVLKDAEGDLRYHLTCMADIVRFLDREEADHDGDYKEWLKQTEGKVKKEVGVERTQGE
jgi:hypothetical protein